MRAWPLLLLAACGARSPLPGCLEGELVACYPSPDGTLDVGACRSGVATCGEVGEVGPCLGAVTPAAELCNGVDDDCDGTADEDCACDPGEVVPCYDGPAGTLGVGLCAAGSALCDATGHPGACEGQVLPGADACNGLDDDCDGAADEDCECVPGETVACYDGPAGTLGVGPCASGLAACSATGTLGPCLGQVLPGGESCNDLDDDCDGTVDEGVCPTMGLGCADGTREGFLDEDVYFAIAACAGGFQVPGLLGELAVQCAHQGGDDGPNPSGAGCSAEDLCAVGFHVCLNEQEVAVRSPTGCAGSAPDPGLFFATRQSGPGCGICALGTQSLPGCDSCSCVAGCKPTELTANDVFGCGSAGDATSGCGVLDRFSNDTCGLLPAPWACGFDGCSEAHNVSKPGAQGGGVLCCSD